jgi:ketol-acid reductoisomerase
LYAFTGSIVTVINKRFYHGLYCNQDGYACQEKYRQEIWKGPFRDAVAPVFDKLYESVRTSEETRIVLSVNNAPDYREKLNAELETMNKTEMWQAGAAVRALRPENRKG